MNFNWLILIIFFSISCGVKTKPKPPKGTLAPPVHKKYIQKFKS